MKYDDPYGRQKPGPKSAPWQQKRDAIRHWETTQVLLAAETLTTLHPYERFTAADLIHLVNKAYRDRFVKAHVLRAMESDTGIKKYRKTKNEFGRVAWERRRRVA